MKVGHQRSAELHRQVLHTEQNRRMRRGLGFSCFSFHSADFVQKLNIGFYPVNLDEFV